MEVEKPLIPLAKIGPGIAEEPSDYVRRIRPAMMAFGLIMLALAFPYARDHWKSKKPATDLAFPQPHLSDPIREERERIQKILERSDPNQISPQSPDAPYEAHKDSLMSAE